MWDALDKNLQHAYLRSHELPVPKTSSRAKGVVWVDKDDESVTKTYTRIADAVKDSGVARETIAAACNEGTLLKDARWRWM